MQTSAPGNLKRARGVRQVLTRLLEAHSQGEETLCRHPALEGLDTGREFIAGNGKNAPLSKADQTIKPLSTRIHGQPGQPTHRPGVEFTLRPIANRYTHRHRQSMPDKMPARSTTPPHWPILIIASWLSANPVYAAQPLFDAHLHYNVEDAAEFTPEAIISRLQANHVDAAIVTSRPPEQLLQLLAQAPDLIVPMLGVYRTRADKETWMHDRSLPARVKQALTEGPWRAVGELHLFAEDRRSPVFMQIVELATSRGLPLQLHCDPAVIDSVFEQAPEATVIWAHAGAYPYPPLLRDYLQRYPGLYIDLSVRDQRVAPDGRLDPEWELLLLEYSERFMVGVDTYRTDRWHAFSEAVGQIRNWLGQLPEGVSDAIAYRNAARVFGKNTDD